MPTRSTNRFAVLNQDLAPTARPAPTPPASNRILLPRANYAPLLPRAPNHPRKKPHLPPATAHPPKAQKDTIPIRPLCRTVILPSIEAFFANYFHPDIKAPSDELARLFRAFLQSVQNANRSRGTVLGGANVKPAGVAALLAVKQTTDGAKREVDLAALEAGVRELGGVFGRDGLPSQGARKAWDAFAKEARRAAEDKRRAGRRLDERWEKEYPALGPGVVKVVPVWVR